MPAEKFLLRPSMRLACLDPAVSLALAYSIAKPQRQRVKCVI